MSTEDQTQSQRATLRLARQVAMPQGAIFLRDLLRRKQRSDPRVRIGVGKRQIERNLEAAIRLGAITSGDLDRWLGEVEGWGRQHVYLYRGTQKLRDDPIWSSSAALRERLATARADGAWRSPEHPSFPKKLVLGRADFRDGRFEILWRKRRETWIREDRRDKPNEYIEGYKYEFRAFRQELSRAVMRFVFFPSKFKAALFVQLPLGNDHDEAREMAERTLGKIFAFKRLKPVDVSKAIKALDRLELDDDESDRHGLVQSENTKFRDLAGNATIEFEADPSIVAWKKVPAVRRVRRALRGDEFHGVHGRFRVRLRQAGLERDIKMSMAGPDSRIYLYAQMNAAEVWTVLDEVRRRGR